MTGFTIVWLGQLVSLLATGMTAFGIIIWVWEETGRATALTTVAFFGFLPVVLMSPIAGALIDRWNRKLTMMLSDIASGLATIAALMLYTTGGLEVWHLYVWGAWSGIFSAFQFPAFSAAITTMIPKKHYTRANAMRSLAGSASGIAAPIVAGILLSFTGLATILVIDVITFVFAALTLLFVNIPQPLKPVNLSDKLTGFWDEVVYGFRYLYRHRGLLGLLFAFTSLNFFGELSLILLSPMILARTGNDKLILGSVRSAIGLGGLAGGLFVSMWGGPKRKVHGIILGIIGGAVSTTGFGFGRSLPIWAAAAFFSFFFFPMIDAFYGAIKQSKVPPHVQGKVFASSRLVSHSATPLAILLAGLLADGVLEPAMMPGGALVDTFGWLVGTGPGSGMALMFVISGILVVLVGVVAYLYRPVREIEDLMPDYDEAQTLSSEEGVPDDSPSGAPSTAGVN